jgi:hypothetical protein
MLVSHVTNTKPQHLNSSAQPPKKSPWQSLQRSPAGRPCPSLSLSIASLSPSFTPLSATINKIDNSNNYSDKLNNTELLNRARYPTACKSYPVAKLQASTPPHPPQPQAVEDRPLSTIPHNGTITHDGIPNPNYVAESDIPQYAAIRLPNCVSGNEAQRLLDQVKELKDVRSTAAFFLPARLVSKQKA